MTDICSAESFFKLMKQYKKAKFMYIVSRGNYIYNTIDTDKLELSAFRAEKYSTLDLK